MHKKAYHLQEDIKGCHMQGLDRQLVNWNVSYGQMVQPDEDVDTVSSRFFWLRTHAPNEKLPVKTLHMTALDVPLKVVCFLMHKYS
jgi:hypothetical protein